LRHEDVRNQTQWRYKEINTGNSSKTAGKNGDCRFGSVCGPRQFKTPKQRYMNYKDKLQNTFTVRAPIRLSDLLEQMTTYFKKSYSSFDSQTNFPFSSSSICIPNFRCERYQHNFWAQRDVNENSAASQPLTSLLENSNTITPHPNLWSHVTYITR
jgi:hypothetical protein